LIGGSVALALHTRGEPGQWHVTAWSRNPAPVQRAVADGAVEVAAPTLEEAVRDAEVVLLAAPPLACLDLTDRLGGPLRDALPEDCTVTDVASAKSRIVDRADELKLPFIGGHPMAGRELSGYEAALPDLFVQRAWVTVLESIQAGADGYLTKDRAIDDVVNAVRAAYAGETLLPRSVILGIAQRVAAARERGTERRQIEPLTPRELEVLKALTEGLATPEICERLYIAPNTLRTHVQNIMGKLRVHSKLEAVAFALRHHLVEPPKSDDSLF